MCLLNQKPDNGEVLTCMHTSTPAWLLYHSEDFFQPKNKLFKTCEGRPPARPSKSYLNAAKGFLSPREGANEGSPFSNCSGLQVSSLPTTERWIPSSAGPAVPPIGPSCKPDHCVNSTEKPPSPNNDRLFCPPTFATYSTAPKTCCVSITEPAV